MTSREEMLTALARREPNSVPLDLGEQVTTIQRVTYDRIKHYLSIKKPTRTLLLGVVGDVLCSGPSWEIQPD